MKEYVLLITGGFWSGKSSFIQSASDPEPAPVKFLASHSVSADRSSIMVKGGVFHLFAPPSTRRFDFMWEMMASERLAGCIVMVDSTRVNEFREAKGIIEVFTAYFPVPYVVAANKQDQSDAWNVEAIHIAMRLAPDVPVIPCIATDRASVKNVLLALCYKILADIEQSQVGK